MHYPSNLLKSVLYNIKEMRLEGFVEGQGPIRPKLMLIGEAPGREEIKKGIPFCGRAGKHLMKSLENIGLERRDVYITSTVRSRPYSVKKVIDTDTNKERILYPNRPPTKKEQQIFAPILDWEIENFCPELIITLGSVSLQRLLNSKVKLSDVHGTIIKSPIKKLSDDGYSYIFSKREYVIIPNYHPAALFYNGSLKITIEEDWKVVEKYLKK